MEAPGGQLKLSREHLAGGDSVGLKRGSLGAADFLAPAASCPVLGSG